MAGRSRRQESSVQNDSEMLNQNDFERLSLVYSLPSTLGIIHGLYRHIILATKSEKPTKEETEFLRIFARIEAAVVLLKLSACPRDAAERSQKPTLFLEKYLTTHIKRESITFQEIWKACLDQETKIYDADINITETKVPDNLSESRNDTLSDSRMIANALAERGKQATREWGKIISPYCAEYSLIYKAMLAVTALNKKGYFGGRAYAQGTLVYTLWQTNISLEAIYAHHKARAKDEIAIGDTDVIVRSYREASRALQREMEGVRGELAGVRSELFNMTIANQTLNQTINASMAAGWERSRDDSRYSQSQLFRAPTKTIGKAKRRLIAKIDDERYECIKAICDLIGKHPSNKEELGGLLSILVTAAATSDTTKDDDTVETWFMKHPNFSDALKAYKTLPPNTIKDIKGYYKVVALLYKYGGECLEKDDPLHHFPRSEELKEHFHQLRPDGGSTSTAINGF